MKEAIKTITLLVFVVGMVGCELLGDSSDHYPVSAKINGVLYQSENDLMAWAADFDLEHYDGVFDLKFCRKVHYKEQTANLVIQTVSDGFLELKKKYPLTGLSSISFRDELSQSIFGSGIGYPKSGWVMVTDTAHCRSFHSLVMQGEFEFEIQPVGEDTLVVREGRFGPVTFYVDHKSPNW